MIELTKSEAFCVKNGSKKIRSWFGKHSGNSFDVCSHGKICSEDILTKLSWLHPAKSLEQCQKFKNAIFQRYGKMASQNFHMLCGFK